MQRETIFLYTAISNSKKSLKIPFLITLKKIKCLEIYITNNVRFSMMKTIKIGYRNNTNPSQTFRIYRRKPD